MMTMENLGMSLKYCFLLKFLNEEVIIFILNGFSLIEKLSDAMKPEFYLE